MGCAECHDHKYDPFTTSDFYRFAAFFADIKETAVGGQEPTRFPSPAQAAACASSTPDRARSSRPDKPTPELEADQEAWESSLGSCRRTAKDVAQADRSTSSASSREADGGAEEAPGRALPDDRAPARAGPQGARRAPDEAAGASRRRSRRPGRDRRPAARDAGPAARQLARRDRRGRHARRAGVPARRSAVKDRRATRLDLAQLADVAATTRWWPASSSTGSGSSLFGQGLVTTLDDFGSQGAWPTHPELLDWLAVEFLDSGWDVKHMLKLMVMSDTYRQSSRGRRAEPRSATRTTAGWPGRAASASTPRWCATTPWRSAACSSPQIGGPSVKPYQPAGYWAYLNFPTRE